MTPYARSYVLVLHWIRDNPILLALLGFHPAHQVIDSVLKIYEELLGLRFEVKQPHVRLIAIFSSIVNLGDHRC